MKKTTETKRFHIDHSYFMKPIRLDNIMLLQIGERFCRPAMGFPEHEQLCFEITYVYDGEALNTIDGETHKMTANTFNFTFPPQKHSIFAGDSNLRYFYLGFTLAPEHPLYGDFQKLAQSHTRIYIEDKFHSHSTFFDAMQHLSKETPLSQFILVNSVNRILCNFLRGYEGKERSMLTYGNADIILFNMLSFLNEHFLDFRNLDMLSGKLGYSPSYLSHIFTAAMSQSPTAYVLEKKFKYAEQLLQENQMTVTEIAETLGYDTIHAFSKTFKKHYGMSPTDYKKTTETAFCIKNEE